MAAASEKCGHVLWTAGCTFDGTFDDMSEAAVTAQAHLENMGETVKGCVKTMWTTVCTV